MNKSFFPILVLIAVLLAALFTVISVPSVWAQAPIPPAETLIGVYKVQKHFSPYAGRNFPTQVYWGDTHLHTGMSMDAGAFGARLGPEGAERFARATHSAPWHQTDQRDPR